MLGNFIKQTTTTTGTGDLTLSSVSGFATFNHLFSTTQRFRYAILNDSDGSPIEIGFGHLSASTTLVRDYVLATYVSGTYTRAESAASQVTLAAGTKRVICVADDSAAMLNPMRCFSRQNGTANSKVITPANYLSNNASNLLIGAAPNRIYAWPIYVPERGPIDALCLRCSGTGLTIDMALYRTDESGLPGSLVAGATGVASAAGATFGTFSSVVITPGWYYAAYNSSGTSINVYNGQLNGDSMGRSDVVNQTPLLYMTQTQGTLPDPFGTPTSIGASLSGSLVPLIGLRLS